jgi:hypothetical protein
MLIPPAVRENDFRVRMTTGCRDADSIPKVENAGQVFPHRLRGLRGKRLEELDLLQFPTRTTISHRGYASFPEARCEWFELLPSTKAPRRARWPSVVRWLSWSDTTRI